MKKKLLKFFIIMIAVCLTLLIISNTQVQAALQSNPNTHGMKSASATSWMTNFRNMETTGGALGLTETIDETTMLPTSKSNSLDSHMMRSTEYGAIAILSASGYGNPNAIHYSTIKSTTGNETGVYLVNLGSDEFAAGGLSGYIFSGVDGRYYDAYTDSNMSAKVGDALGNKDTPNEGCAKWHSTPNAGWVSTQMPYFRRNAAARIFDFSPYDNSSRFLGRGVVVCGEGL